MEVFSWKNQFGKWKCHQRDEILRRMFTRAWFWQEGNYFSIWISRENVSNAELSWGNKPHFLKFLYVFVSPFLRCWDEKYMALTATYSHSSLIVFLSHNIIGLYFKTNKTHCSVVLTYFRLHLESFSIL